MPKFDFNKVGMESLYWNHTSEWLLLVIRNSKLKLVCFICFHISRLWVEKISCDGVEILANVFCKSFVDDKFDQTPFSFSRETYVAVIYEYIFEE